MKVLTVLQPWASAILEAGKDVENRSTLWKYRGPLAIHAGVGWSRTGQESYLLRRAMRAVYGDTPWWRDLPRAALIGVVDLVDVHLSEPGCCLSVWAEDPAHVHLVLERPRTLAEPILCPGRLGLWEPRTPDGQPDDATLRILEAAR